MQQSDGHKTSKIIDQSIKEPTLVNKTLIFFVNQGIYRQKGYILR